MLQVAKNKGISYEKFFKDFDTTYDNFKGKSLNSSLRSHVIVDFSTKHPDVDLHWLITGQTKYTNNETHNIVAETSSEYVDYKEKYYKCTEKYMQINEELKDLKIKFKL